jgi:uncharacterized membrane protein YedE/YeeE
MRHAVNFLVGLIFGLGLLISGMANPAKVQNFLDLAGSFDPSLIFVMASALAVTFVGYRLVLRRERPVLAERFYLPSASIIDGRLILGAAMFGVGWGLSGFCPGPAIVSLPLLANGTLIFVPAMLAGIGVARLRMQGKASRADPVAQAE